MPSLSCGMPIPVSLTERTMNPSAGSISMRSDTCPWAVNFSAFETKLLAT